MVCRRLRLCENLEFPRYAFVPGQTPHPRRVSGDSHALPEPSDDRSAILFGVDLFNHGYFWEAHELWEGPWRAAAEGSDRKIFLKALIRLAAAALKLRLGSAAGVAAHAPWSARAFADLAQRNASLEGLSPGELRELAQAIAAGNLNLQRGFGTAQPAFGQQIVPVDDGLP